KKVSPIQGGSASGASNARCCGREHEPDCRWVHGKDDPQCKTVGLDCGLPEQLDDIDWRKQICDTAVTFCALSGAADPSSVCANLRPPCDWHPGRSACSAG